MHICTSVHKEQSICCIKHLNKHSILRRKVLKELLLPSGQNKVSWFLFLYLLLVQML